MIDEPNPIVSQPPHQPYGRPSERAKLLFHLSGCYFSSILTNAIGINTILTLTLGKLRYAEGK